MSRNGHDWAIAVFKDRKYIKTISGKGSKHTYKSVKEVKKEYEPNLIVWYENTYLWLGIGFILGKI